MNQSAILNWLADSQIGGTIRDSSWLFPAFESLHFIGLCFLFGAILIVDLRLLGFLRQISPAAVIKLIPVALFGFLCIFISGAAFFVSDPLNYATSVAFLIKMFLVLVGGLNALWFEYAERRKVSLLAVDADTDLNTKIIAGLSICLWIVVLMLGRLLPYIGLST